MGEYNQLNQRLIYKGFEPWPEDTRGWGGDSPFFRTMIQEVSPKIIFEVGAWKGQSTINMARYLKQENIDCVIYSIDTWLGAVEFWEWGDESRNLHLKNGYPQVYYQFLSNIIHNGVEKYVIPFPTSSISAARYFAQNEIKADLIYIDASHEEDDVYMDLKYYYPLLTKGGKIFGDDYNNGAFPGLRKDVNKFAWDHSLKVNEESRFWWYETNNSWYGRFRSLLRNRCL